VFGNTHKDDMQTLVTLEELDAALTVVPLKLPALDADIDADTLLEIAAEADERGPLATIKGLLEGLRVRHAGDTTLAVLAALEHYHLPMLLGDAKA
jgi:hypothetical protein